MLVSVWYPQLSPLDKMSLAKINIYLWWMQTPKLVLFLKNNWFVDNSEYDDWGEEPAGDP